MEQDHRCSNKAKYYKKTAQTILNERLKEGEKYLRIYACPKCGFFHLTHQESRDRGGFIKAIRPFIKGNKRKFVFDPDEE